MSFKIILFCCLISTAITTPTRTKRRVHLPFLGFGPYCTGCPPQFCDDDPAIIHGYCCGCASYFDSLPIRCPVYLNCPLNGDRLCQDYEYMMHCCCEGR